MGYTWKEYQEAGRIMKDYEKSQNPLPYCPTCGGANVRRISSTEKVGNAVALGFFGNKRKQQFECCNPNCKYRW